MQPASRSPGFARRPLRVWLFALVYILAMGVLVGASAHAQATEGSGSAQGGVAAAGEPDDDGGFNLETAKTVGLFVGPLITAGAGFLGGKARANKQHRREYDRDQSVAVQDFLDASTQIAARLQPFAAGAGPASSLVPLQEELLNLGTIAGRIDDATFKRQGKTFYDNASGAVIAALTGASEQPPAERALAEFSELRKQGEGLRRKLTSPPPSRFRRRGAEHVAGFAPPRRREASEREDSGQADADLLS